MDQHGAVEVLVHVSSQLTIDLEDIAFVQEGGMGNGTGLANALSGQLMGDETGAPAGSKNVSLSSRRAWRWGFTSIPHRRTGRRRSCRTWP